MKISTILTLTKSVLVSTTLILCCSNLFAQSTFYVKESATGTGIGSWANATGDLQVALAAAANGDEIWVAAGTYYPDVTDKEICFDIIDGIKVYGGFPNTGSPVFADRDHELYETILSGEINGSGIGDNSFTIVCTQNVSSNTIVDGFTISDGNAISTASGDANPGKSGGGWFNDGSKLNAPSNPTIKNCHFLNNYAQKWGGAFYNKGKDGGVANPILENCTFTNNEAPQGGGGFYNDGSSFDINDPGTCSPKLVGCIFTGNTAIYGGAIFNNGNIGVITPTFINTQFISNSSASVGGAIYSLGKESTGLITQDLINCLFLNNSSGSAGGVYGLSNDESTVTSNIINCTFSGNTANVGSSVYCNEDPTSTSEAIITNSIFWGNSAGTGPIFRFSGDGSASMTISHSLVDLADCTALQNSVGNSGTIDCSGPGMVYNQDPLFNSDYTVAIGSSAIDAGSNAALPTDDCDLDEDANTSESLSEDMAGNERIYNNATVDLGSFESAFSTLPIELYSFEARIKELYADLIWVTASEINNDFFTIERSKDGNNFEEVAKVKGSGTSFDFKQYQYTDQNPFMGLSYYRIKQTDFNGKYSYSPIRTVNIETEAIRIFPNPVEDLLNISISGFTKEVVDYEIYSMTGKLMYKNVATVNDGISTISLTEVFSFVPGSYFIRIYSDEKKHTTHKFLKIRK